MSDIYASKPEIISDNYRDYKVIEKIIDSLDKKLETVLHLLINVDKNGKNLKEYLQ